jgi:hypothetical protein
MLPLTSVNQSSQLTGEEQKILTAIKNLEELKELSRSYQY